ncbi:hypothetical protein B0H19DRAFT_1254478 [Mycena capillaripes]|nr:hypothetical protein B0H19DRAFT_1254478 [Mycena capillaripes]
MESLDDATLAFIQSLTPEQGAVLRKALHTNAEAVLEALPSSKHPTPSEPRPALKTFKIVAVWPNNRTLPLLYRVRFTLGDCVRKCSWAIHATRCVLGIITPSSPAPLPDVVIRETISPDSPALNSEDDLQDLLGEKVHKVFYAHLASSVPFPSGNDLQSTSPERTLTEEEKGRIKGAANYHCALTGRFDVDGEHGHECLHLVPSAVATDAFERFIQAARNADNTFPDLKTCMTKAISYFWTSNFTVDLITMPWAYVLQ